MNAAEFESTLRAEGFDEIVDKELPAEYRAAEHAHPFDVRALVLSGEITLTVEGRARAYREGEVFVMPAGCRHEERVGSAGVRYVAGRRHLK
ncbi:MAG TPA: cupin domain-containing protein [Burkholderiales bacterium]|jgi:quercetin dioxygenase-like cupin family protein|nr:cupin domain-containing protein [Burkholderiales bacterium]